MQSCPRGPSGPETAQHNVEYGTYVGYNPVSTAGAEQGVLALFKQTLLK